MNVRAVKGKKMETTRRIFVGIGAATAAMGLDKVLAAPVHASAAKDKFWVAAVTPCDKNYNFDEGAYRDQLSWWKANGADGVLVLGTNGEGPSYSVAERKKIAEFALKNKMGLDMIVATGTANFKETIELSQHAAAVGADSVLIQPPFYFKNPAGEGVVRYFSAIFDKVKTPVRYYHIPKVTGVPVGLTVFHALAQYPNFIGIKDSNGDVAEYAAIADGLPARLNIASGTDNNMRAAVKRGNGVILGSGNVYTKYVAAIFAAHRAGKDIDEPLARMAKATSLMEGGDYYNPSAIKYTLSLMMENSRTTFTRPPWLEIGDDVKAKIRIGVNKLKAMG